jgi:hypothetical protein
VSIYTRLINLTGSVYEAARFLDRPTNTLPGGLSPNNAIAAGHFGAVEALITALERTPEGRPN